MKNKKEHPMAWKFRRTYANIPIPLRSEEICCLIDGEPMTFSVVKMEVDNTTQVGYDAIEQLLKLKIM